jgi:hypothetical protein
VTYQSNFSSKEFACPDCGKASVTGELIMALEELRAVAKLPIRVSFPAIDAQSTTPPPMGLVIRSTCSARLRTFAYSDSITNMHTKPRSRYQRSTSAGSESTTATSCMSTFVMVKRDGRELRESMWASTNLYGPQGWQ